MLINKRKNDNLRQQKCRALKKVAKQEAHAFALTAAEEVVDIDTTDTIHNDVLVDTVDIDTTDTIHNTIDVLTAARDIHIHDDDVHIDTIDIDTVHDIDNIITCKNISVRYPLNRSCKRSTSLYCMESSLLVWNANSMQYDLPMGKGLFSTTVIPKGKLICNYRGTLTGKLLSIYYINTCMMTFLITL